MDNPIIESPKLNDEEETVRQENDTEAMIAAGSTSLEPPSTIDYGAKKLARDAKAKRKDEKTVQQVLKSLDGLKTPDEKLSAMCKKYSELLHENRQLQATVKQLEKNINMIHREKEQFRHERSKAVLAKTRMEQLCRELQKLNKAQQEETALKLRVEEEKRKEICFTFQSTFAEMNSLTNQNNEKSARMREENLEMREKIKSVREGIELTEAQLDKVRQQSRLELELAEKKFLRATLELTAEKEALMKDKSQLLMKLAKYHVRVKEQEGTEEFLRKQIRMCEEKFEEFKRDVKKTTDSLKNFRPVTREMKKKMLKLEKETALWKQRWEKTNAAVHQMAEIKEKRDAEMITLNNKLSTLQELCKAFQRERACLMAQLREKNDVGRIVEQPFSDDNRKSMKQVENISKDCEKLKDNLSKLEGSLTEAEREVFCAASYEDIIESDAINVSANFDKKICQKTKNETRKKSNSMKQTAELDAESTNDVKNEATSMEMEIMENTPDMSEIEASDAEIAILERHEIVLKDIEKVLAEQSILEAKIACVKEMGKSICDTDDSTVDAAVMKFTEILAKESEITKNENAEIDESSEIAKIVEIPALTDEKIPDMEKIEKTYEIKGISPMEFIMAHGVFDAEIAKNKIDSNRLNDQTKIKNSAGIEIFEDIEKSFSSVVDSQPNEARSMRAESSMTMHDSDKKEEATNKSEIDESLEIAKIVEIPAVTDEKISDMEKIEKTYEIKGITPDESATAHGPSDSNIAGHKSKFDRLNDLTKITNPKRVSTVEDIDERFIGKNVTTYEITGITPAEFIRFHDAYNAKVVKYKPNRFNDRMKMKNSKGTEIVKVAEESFSSVVDSQPNEARTEKEESATDRPEVMKSIDATSVEIDEISKIRAPVSGNAETNEKIDSASNSALEMKDNVIEA